MTEQKDSSWYYYVCACGASNSPCPDHHPRDAKVMPDDWISTYEAPGAPGLTDEFKAQ